MENLSLFDMTESGQQQINIQPSASLDVVKMIFDGAESCTWPELFSGFDTLHAITYSSGIDFVQKQFHYPNGYVEGLAINLHL